MGKMTDSRAAEAQAQGDRMAIKMLVAAGYVTEAKANEALNIAHGFDKGPLAPPSAPVGVEAREHADVLARQLRWSTTSKRMRAALEAGIAALAKQPAAVDGAWRQKAAEWLEAKAVEQEANNQRWPDHAAAYKEWRDRPGVLRYLAAQVLTTHLGGHDNDR